MLRIYVYVRDTRRIGGLERNECQEQTVARDTRRIGGLEIKKSD